MRVITGKYKGRKIDCPPGIAVRPTSDKVRGSIFNILNNYTDYENANVLDICCGTGALGLEALSRGAKFASFVDNAEQSIKYTKQNLEKLPPQDYEVLRLSADKINYSNKKYDLVFLDPPYRTNLAQDVLELLIAKQLVNKNAIVVVEIADNQELIIPQNCEVLSTRIYGNTKVLIITIVP